VALLIATTSGLWQIAPRSWLPRRHLVLREQPIAALTRLPDGSIICITDAGDLWRRKRGECSWQPVAARIEGASQLPTPTALACEATGALWCGVSPIDLWRGVPRADGQEIVWECCEALRAHPAALDWWGPDRDGSPRLTSIVTIPGEPGHALVAVAVGGVWQTINHGQTWVMRHEGITPLLPPDARFTSAHRAVLDLACHPSARALLARTDTALYHADLAGDEWQWRDITPPAPELAVHWPISATFAYGDPATIWAVMTGHDGDRALTLWCTRNSGTTWNAIARCPPELSADAGAIVLADRRRSRRIVVLSGETLWLWRGVRWRRLAHGLGQIADALWL
jgi:hypothetical protein